MPWSFSGHKVNGDAMWLSWQQHIHRIVLHDLGVCVHVRVCVCVCVFMCVCMCVFMCVCICV